MELIQIGKQDTFWLEAGEVHWAMTAMFDAMTALSSKYNDKPKTASRAYDKTRDGFVIAGAGVLVLENKSMQKREVQKYMLSLQVTVLPQMVMTWWRHLVKAREVCKWQCPLQKIKLIT